MSIRNMPTEGSGSSSNEIHKSSQDGQPADSETQDGQPACKRAKIDASVESQPEELESDPTESFTNNKSDVDAFQNDRGVNEIDCTEKAMTGEDDLKSNNVNDNKDEIDTLEKQSPLTEVQAGITEYLGDHNGFSAIIKQRYSDFIVNEVDTEGNVVHLKNLSDLEDDEQEEDIDDDKMKAELLNAVSAEDMTKIQELVKSNDKSATVNILAPEDKNQRTKIHLAIKKCYMQLETKTTEVNGEKIIQVVYKSGNSRNSRERDEWPHSKKSCRYVKFVLYKENKDTMDAVSLISKNLKVKESMFQYAGTKDKRAKTSQEVTAHRIHPKKLSFLNKVLRNMGLGDFRYVTDPLKLGQLSGNQFTIVLRNVQASNEVVEQAISSFKSHGFINYFGMQRFGTTSVPTHKVGRALLHGDWEKAVDLILMPRDDFPAKDIFQKVWMDTHDPEATLKVTPRFCGLERTLLEALKRKMKPFNALEKISRNTRLLYVHSYQALIWNQIVSKRLQRMGHKPVVGDLVLTRNAAEPLQPTMVTPDNLDQFYLQDVVLPLPGHDVVYPENGVAKWYREALSADGLDIDNLKRPQKDYSLPGAYRHMTVCPADVSWSYHRYDDYTQPLVLSDLDVIKEEIIPVSHNKGKFKAVVLKMTLPPSSYATMALREVLRQDTSVAHQTSLNVT